MIRTHSVEHELLQNALITVLGVAIFQWWPQEEHIGAYGRPIRVWQQHDGQGV